MKKYLQLLFSLMLCICVYSCKTPQQQTNLYSVSLTSVYNMDLDTLNNVQVDSMISVDKLPKYNKWQKVYLQDFETGQRNEYSTLFDKTTNIIYTVKYIKEEELYIVKKRKTTNK